MIGVFVGFSRIFLLEILIFKGTDPFYERYPYKGKNYMQQILRNKKNIRNKL
jgi:hypothetical protein